METLISVARAQEILASYPFKWATEEIGLEHAQGRILARDILALCNDPPFDNSSIDGWAVQLSDLPESRIEIGTIFAGDQPITKSLNPTEIYRIMTGAPIPLGADALVMVEDGIQGLPRQDYIRRKGENISLGEVALSTGDLVTSSSCALAATIGHKSLPVRSKLRIAIIPTGDELTELGKPLEPGRIYDSNSIALSALIRKAGAEPIIIKPVLDSEESLHKTLDYCAEEVDLILTSGGVSMGEKDLIRSSLIERNAAIFWKVLMRPGGPPIFGHWNGTPIFGLPGNPVSSQTVFHLLIVPWISHPDIFHRRVIVKMEEGLRGAGNRLCLRRIQITSSESGLVGRALTHQGSGNVRSMVLNDALTLIPPNTNIEPGEHVNALWLIA